MSGGGSDVPLLELGVGLSPLLASLAAVQCAVFCCSLIGGLPPAPLAAFKIFCFCWGPTVSV